MLIVLCSLFLVNVTSQFSSLLKEMQGNPLEHSPLSKSEIFSMEYSRIGNKKFFENVRIFWNSLEEGHLS